MKRKLKVLVLAHDQFGYSVTKFKHCEFAQDTFDITYVGWDYGLPKIELPKVKVKYVSRESNVLMRNFRLLKAFHKEIGMGYDVVFINYVRFVSLVKLLNHRVKAILYIDTLGVQEKKYMRWTYNFLLSIESSFFQHIALINGGLSKKINVSKFHLLPLGGDCFSTEPKTFERLSLLYVGTLTNRRILDCVKGFHKYITTIEDSEKCNSTFVIIGDGPNDELKEIKEYISSHNLKSFIRTTGFVPSEKLAPFFDKANIGVSYIPITPYYQYQPPTKTFEYLISGLPVIATATEANKEIVKSSVSELSHDDPDSFCEALLRILARKDDFDSEQIRAQYEKYKWKNVVKNKFIPLIDGVAKL